MSDLSHLSDEKLEEAAQLLVNIQAKHREADQKVRQLAKLVRDEQNRRRHQRRLEAN